MLFQTSLLTILASTGLASALPNEKRVTHDGVATVNPNPNGALGSCGIDSPDSSMTVAIGPSWMGQTSPGPFCGRKIVATNTGPSTDNSVGGKGNKVIITVEDTCEGCDENHLDLSVAAWNALTNGHPFSVVGISWNFCNADGQC